MSKKKLLSIFSIILMIAVLTISKNVSEASGDISKVRIVYGVSEIYSREDMDSAIKIIKDCFSKWDGCKLHSIRYTDDDYCNTEKNIQWMNELAKGQGYEPKFTQCIAFFSDFHSPTNPDNNTTFNVDQEYINWSWYLARIDNGEWKLLTFGY